MDNSGGWRWLVLAMIERAALDARRGDDAARYWLATGGADWLDLLGAAVDMRGWLAELPPVAQPALPGLEAV